MGAAAAERRLTTEVIARYEELLRENVDNQNTLRGYELNLRTFASYAKDQPVTQSMIDAYKKWLVEEQKKTIFSANTTLSGVMKLINLMGCCTWTMALSGGAYQAEAKNLPAVSGRTKRASHFHESI